MKSHDPMERIRTQGKQHRQSAIDRLCIEAGLGAVIVAILGIILLIVSITPLYRANGMQEWVSAIRLLGGLFLFSAIAIGAYHRWMDF